MPIEIKELHIKINVDEGQEGAGRSGSSNVDQNKTDKIIAACVEQVMEILSKNEER
jgi:hypothetical protein